MEKMKKPDPAQQARAMDALLAEIRCGHTGSLSTMDESSNHAT